MDAEFLSPKGEIKHGAATRTITGTQIRDGRKYFCKCTSIKGGAFENEVVVNKLVRKDVSGYYAINETAGESKEQCEAPYPIVRGNVWIHMMSGDPITNRVVEVETVAIGGKYYKECFHVRSESQGAVFTEDFWIAPGVGTIKTIIVWKALSTITLTLREFKTQPK